MSPEWFENSYMWIQIQLNMNWMDMQEWFENLSNESNVLSNSFRWLIFFQITPCDEDAWVYQNTNNFKPKQVINFFMYGILKYVFKANVP